MNWQRETTPYIYKRLCTNTHTSNNSKSHTQYEPPTTTINGEQKADKNKPAQAKAEKSTETDATLLEPTLVNKQEDQKFSAKAKEKTTTSSTEKPMSEPPYSEQPRVLNCTEPFLYRLGVVYIPPLFILVF